MVGRFTQLYDMDWVSGIYFAGLSSLPNKLKKWEDVGFILVYIWHVKAEHDK